jgi:nucleoside phosphorylase
VTTERGSVVALTALDLEYEALHDQLLDVTQRPPLPSGTCYGVGFVRGREWEWEVTLAEIGEGNTSAAAECQRAIDVVDPQLVLFLGVAGSLRADEVRIGDVVLATRVAWFYGGRETDRFHARPVIYECAYPVVQLARVLRQKKERGAWLQRLQPPPDRIPEVHLKPIAAGEVVVAATTSATRAFLEEHYDDAVAVEMESAGMMLAAHQAQLPAAVFRGISDVLVDRGHEGGRERQRLAARNAAAFAVELLTRLQPRRSWEPRREERAGAADRDGPHDGRERTGGPERVINIGGEGRYYERTGHTEHNFYGSPPGDDGRSRGEPDDR